MIPSKVPNVRAGGWWLWAEQEVCTCNVTTLIYGQISPDMAAPPPGPAQQHTAQPAQATQTKMKIVQSRASVARAFK